MSAPTSNESLSLFDIVSQQNREKGEAYTTARVVLVAHCVSGDATSVTSAVERYVEDTNGPDTDDLETPIVSGILIVVNSEYVCGVVEVVGERLPALCSSLSECGLSEARVLSVTDNELRTFPIFAVRAVRVAAAAEPPRLTVSSVLSSAFEVVCGLMDLGRELANIREEHMSERRRSNGHVRYDSGEFDSETLASRCASWLDGGVGQSVSTRAPSAERIQALIAYEDLSSVQQLYDILTSANDDPLESERTWPVEEPLFTS